MQRQIPPIILLPRLTPSMRIRSPRNSRLPPLGQFVEGDVFRIFGGDGAGDAAGVAGAFADAAGGGGEGRVVSGGCVVLIVGGRIHDGYM